MKKYITLTILSVACAFLFTLSNNTVHAQSYTFSTDLTVGSSGTDVSNLQSWLIANGYDIPSISSGANAKGYFGSQTQGALIRYQRAIGLPAYGFFGPMTRGHINNGDNQNNLSALRVTSPNGGEVWTEGTTRTITWTGSSAILNQTGDIVLEYALPACAEPSANPRCMVKMKAPRTIATGVNLSSGQLSWRVGSFIVPSGQISLADCYGGDVNNCLSSSSFAEDGKYKIQICTTNSSTCDESDANFTITTSTQSTSNTPVITGIDAPTTLTIGQTGTWTVHATDPLNGTLSYSVNWGESSILPLELAGNTPESISQNTSFTHAYSTTGTYTATFTVRNSSGQSAQTTSSVTITGSNTSAGPLKIISPNGGETWIKGTMQTITWTSPYYIRATTADLKLNRQYVCTTQICPAIAFAPYTIASGISINQNSYNWNVGAALDYSGVSQTVPDGTYSVQICETGMSNCDSSDAVFNISSTQTSNLPDINIVSPNGGQYWAMGSNDQVTVNVTGDPAQAGNTVMVYLVNSNGQQTYLSNSQTYGSMTGVRTVNVAIPANIPAGQYKMYVTLSNQGSSVIQAYDYTDNYFSIGSPVYPNYSIQCPAGYTCTVNSSH